MTQTQLRKAKLRQEFKTNRLSLSDSDWVLKSSQIYNLLLKQKAVLNAKVVHIYWPLIDKKEVDTRNFISAMWSNDASVGHKKQVILPVVESFSGRPKMNHRLVSKKTELKPNRWGILEPAGGASVRPDLIDVVIVPALGAGLNGHRIGQGRGYYDNFLNQTDALKIGLVFDNCLVNSVPAEKHDIPLDIIITSNKAYPI